MNVPVLLNSGKLQRFLVKTYPGRPPADLIDNPEPVSRFLGSDQIRKTLFFYCEDGGARSRVLGSLLMQPGIDLYFLQGGFAGFRQDQQRYFQQPWDIRLLTGYTGSGKTLVLQALESLGEQVLDLETLAGEKGSAFGKNTAGGQPGQQDFYNRIWTKLRSFDPGKRIYMELKGRLIGELPVPDGLFNQFRSARKIRLQTPLGQRIQNLETAYGSLTPEDAGDALYRISKTLSPDIYAACMNDLQNQDAGSFIRHVIPYYDRTRGYAPSGGPADLAVDCSGKSPVEIAREITESETRSDRLERSDRVGKEN